MNDSIGLPWLAAAALLLPLPVFGAPAGAPFSEAVFTEVVNDVQVFPTAAAKPVKAQKDGRFNAPDIVRTGRKSRAQLTSADGTITRVGANSAFAFDKSTRTMNLEKGSVLFHSPTGKGGGIIVTNSATASVIGTTIIVAATSDGGFKLLVLEGVAKVTFPDGRSASVNAGQMTFVLPGTKVGDAKNASSSSGDSGAPSEKGGLPGPVLDFDLAALAGESGLVGGFGSGLPSVEKIRAAVDTQQESIRDGDLRETGLFIVGAEGKDEFLVVDKSVVDTAVQSYNQSRDASGRFREAIATPLETDGVTTIPDIHLFLTPVVIPADLLPEGVENPDGGFSGLAAGDLKITGAVFDLGFASGLREAIVLGYEKLTFGNITFQVPQGLSKLSIAGGELIIPSGSSVAIGAPSGSSVSVEFDGLRGLNLSGVGFTNNYGSLEIAALTGDTTLSQVVLTAHTDAVIRSPRGATTLTSVTVSAPDSIAVESSGDLAVADSSSFAADGTTSTHSGGFTTFDNTSAPPVNTFPVSGTAHFSGSNIHFADSTARASHKIELRSDGMITAVNASFDSMETQLGGHTGTVADKVILTSVTFANSVNVSLAANTVALTDVTFADPSRVLIRTASGNVTIAGTLTYGTTDITTSANGIWIPVTNTGDADAPVHVLSLTAPDFFTKLDYARANTLAATGANPFPNGIPNSFAFTVAPSLTNADLGLPDSVVLPALDYPTLGESHSALEVTGLLARDISLNNATLDMSRFDSMSSYHVDIVAGGVFSLSGAITLNGLSNKRIVELRAKNFNIAPGTSIGGDPLPYVAGSDADASAITLASVYGLTLPSFTLYNSPGSVRIYTADANAGIALTSTSLVAGGTVTGATMAGDVEIKAGGGVNISGTSYLSASRDVAITSVTSDVVIDGGTLSSGRAASATTSSPLLAGDIKVASPGRIDIRNGATLTSETGAITLAGSQVNLSNASLRVIATAGAPIPPEQNAYAGKIEIRGAVAVSISGGSLRASDIRIYGIDPATSSPATLEKIDVDGSPTFVANTLPDGTNRGIFMEAKTVNVANTTFPDKTEIRLNSQTGALNFGSKLFGAVNFVNNVGVTVGGSTRQLVDAAGNANTNNAASLVWVAGGSGSVYVNGVSAPSVATQSDHTVAPIHIQQVGASPVSGINHP